MEYVIVFPDANSAVWAERKVLEAGLNVSVMPLPESIGSGCGITLRICGESLNNALDVLRESSISVSAVYAREKTGRGYKYTIK